MGAINRSDEHSVPNVESTTSHFGEFDVECDLGRGLQLRSNFLTEELCLPSVESTIERTKDIPEVPIQSRLSERQQRVRNILERRSNAVPAKMGRSYHGPK